MKKWKCTICDYIHEGPEPPDECPVCGADKDAFIEITEKSETPAGKQQTEQTSTEQAEGEIRKWKCTICNYVHEGPEPPDECPVCGADKSAFVEITAEDTASAAAETAAKEETPTASPEKVVSKEKSSQPFGFLGTLVMKFHLHAISVHTPNGVIPMAIVFLALGMYLSFASLEFASFFSLVFVLLSMPVVILTGIISWQRKYKGANTWVFKTKIGCSIIVSVLLTIMVLWRFIDSSVALSGGTSALIYLGLGLFMVGVAGIAGHLGGTLVHGK